MSPFKIKWKKKHGNSKKYIKNEMNFINWFRESKKKIKNETRFKYCPFVVIKMKNETFKKQKKIMLDKKNK